MTLSPWKWIFSEMALGLKCTSWNSWKSSFRHIRTSSSRCHNNCVKPWRVSYLSWIRLYLSRNKFYSRGLLRLFRSPLLKDVFESLVIILSISIHQKTTYALLLRLGIVVLASFLIPCVVEKFASASSLHLNSFFVKDNQQNRSTMVWWVF